MQEEKLKISNSRLSNIFFLSLPLSFLYYLYSQPVRARFYVPILRLLLFPFILSFSFSNCTLLRWIFRRPPLASLEQNPSSVVVPYPLQDPTIPCIPIAFPEPLPIYLPTPRYFPRFVFVGPSRRSCFCFELTLGGFRVREFI